MKKFVFTLFFIAIYAYCNAQISVSVAPSFYKQINSSDYESANSFSSMDLLVTKDTSLNKYLFLQYGIGLQNRNATKEYDFGVGIINQQFLYVPISLNLKGATSDKLSFYYGAGFSLSSPGTQKLVFSQDTAIPESFVGIDGKKRFLKFTLFAQMGLRYAIHEKFDIVSSISGGYDIKALTIKKQNNPNAYFNTASISLGLSYNFNRNKK